MEVPERKGTKHVSSHIVLQLLSPALVGSSPGCCAPGEPEVQAGWHLADSESVPQPMFTPPQMWSACPSSPLRRVRATYW